MRLRDLLLALALLAGLVTCTVWSYSPERNRDLTIQAVQP